MRDLGNGTAARYAFWSVSQQNAQTVLLLLDLPLKVWNLGLGREEQLLGLAHVRERAAAALF